MKSVDSQSVRQAFLDYFADKGHQPVSASSLVPGNDPTLLFTNAGMVQFKDVFLGLDKRDYARATTSQKCMRISGKHNDLENVGPSPRHHTFFEMLGNFSFGDYFKRDAIRYAYELLTDVYGLPADRLAFTVYEDDDEAYDIWVNDVGVPANRVARMGPKTNFWQMAETGPCGPTSEIHWDLTPELGEDSIIEALQLEDDRFLELWNLVFMQYNRTEADPTHTGVYDIPLPAPGVDTGMGLERVVAVLQSAESNYDTDLYTDIMDATQDILGHDDEFRQEHYVAYRVIADHIRAVSFLIADGVNPGPAGRDYIPRMLIRRALRFAHKMGVERPFLSAVSQAVINKMNAIYPELSQFQDSIQYQISTEEDRFQRMLSSSLSVLDDRIAEMKDSGQTVMDGEAAFDLYATHGLPLEITRDVLVEEGLSVDEAGYKAAEAEHTIRSRSDTKIIEGAEVYQELRHTLQEEGHLPSGNVAYNPYDYNAMVDFPCRIVGMVKDGNIISSADRGDTIEVVLDRTYFYVESGGQVSDTGTISGDGWEITVTDVAKPVGGLITHIGEVTTGVVEVGQSAQGSIDRLRRWDIMRNHTATHLLHAALRAELGPHVRQKGSLVAPDRLRFDFTHNEAIRPDELDRITDAVNEAVLRNHPILIAYKSLDEAKEEGAMALFGEKYGSEVRTVQIPEEEADSPYSYELCGGTHVQTTAEIGQIIVTREESSSAGVRRIEAVTGHVARDYVTRQMQALQQIAVQVHADTDTAPEKVAALLDELDAAYGQLDQMQRSQAFDDLDSILSARQEINGLDVVAAVVSIPDGDLLGELVDRIHDHVSSGVVLLGAAIDGKVRLTAKVTPEAVGKGLHAGKLVSQTAKMVGGGGGGNPEFASAGGRNPDALDEAIASVPDMVRAMLDA